jgi:hypothetical protein
LCLIAGCTPQDEEVSAEPEPTPVLDEKAPAYDEKAPEPSVDISLDFLDSVKPPENQREYVVLCEPWDRYFRSNPYILVLNRTSTGISELLVAEQKLANAVLDMSAGSEESSDYSVLKEQLAELKTFIPAAETASGYVERSHRGY